MLPLKLFRSKPRALPDLLNWAALIDEGIVLNKDGSLLTGFFYRGQDIDSSTASERNHIAARVNAALARFGSGWVTWHDAVRLPAALYPEPEASHFPDPVTRLIDAERRAQFLRAGTHFESDYVLTVSYMPPDRRQSGLAEMMYEDDGKQAEDGTGDRVLRQFKLALGEFEDALGTVMNLRRMRGYSVTDASGREHLRDELVDYLQFALTGRSHGVNIPPGAMYLDAILGGDDLWGGDTPRLGERFICCISLQGFPAESYPGILSVLDHFAIPYRWSSRFIHLDTEAALGELRKYRRKWKQKTRGFMSQVFRTPGGVVNEDALLMAGETEAAMNDAHSAMVTFGFYSPAIVLMNERREILVEQAREICREIQKDGFACRIETVNTLETWLGTLPGHAQPNIRRPLIHTLHLSDLLPLSGVWAGRDHCPCPLYPEASPPLLHAATKGATPFRLNLHVGDVGHTLVFGPTGAGKSTLLATIAAQFRRYEGATIYAFDKGRSLMALALACGGRHHDIGGEDQKLGLCPLADLDTERDVAWAADWLAACFQLQSGKRPSPRQMQEIHRALSLMRRTRLRSLTDFNSTIQDEEVRLALEYYTLKGGMGFLLDAEEDGLEQADFQVFELEELMGLGEQNVIPVLLYLFRRFEKGLRGQPALLLLDEAWIMLGHEVFREKIREWLKVLRKANCAVVLATQSLSDAVKSGILDVLLEACPTKILLPNEEADKEGSERYMGPRDLYELFGLNEMQIEILRTALKKRHYYYVSPEGRRLFDLDLGPVALSFVGVSDKEQLAQVRALADEHGPAWPSVWLSRRKVNHARYA